MDAKGATQPKKPLYLKKQRDKQKKVATKSAQRGKKSPMFGKKQSKTGKKSKEAKKIGKKTPKSAIKLPKNEQLPIKPGDDSKKGILKPEPVPNEVYEELGDEKLIKVMILITAISAMLPILGVSLCYFSVGKVLAFYIPIVCMSIGALLSLITTIYISIEIHTKVFNFFILVFTVFAVATTISMAANVTVFDKARSKRSLPQFTDDDIIKKFSKESTYIGVLLVFFFIFILGTIGVYKFAYSRIHENNEKMNRHKCKPSGDYPPYPLDPELGDLDNTGYRDHAVYLASRHRGYGETTNGNYPCKDVT